MTALCQGAGFAAMEECVDIDKVLLMTYNHLIRKMKISSRHFDIAIKRITPRITSAMIQFYNKYESSG